MFSITKNSIPARIKDPELGEIIFRLNPRAKRIIMRTKQDAIYVTVPPSVSWKQVQEVLKEHKEVILKSKKKMVMHPIDLSFEIKTDLLHILLETGTNGHFLLNNKPIASISKNSTLPATESETISLCMLMASPQTVFSSGVSRIICPPGTDFQEKRMQEWLHKVIEGILRKQAKNYLPIRLQQLSEEYHLPISDITIKSNHSNWGSCSSRKNINLSLYLMLLPSHLIDYVLLHELCHTREMNHGERFWALLNSFTNGKAHPLRNELRKYKTLF